MSLSLNLVESIVNFICYFHFSPIILNWLNITIIEFKRFIEKLKETSKYLPIKHIYNLYLCQSLLINIFNLTWFWNWFYLKQWAIFKKYSKYIFKRKTNMFVYRDRKRVRRLIDNNNKKKAFFVKYSFNFLFFHYHILFL